MTDIEEEDIDEIESEEWTNASTIRDLYFTVRQLRKELGLQERRLSNLERRSIQSETDDKAIYELLDDMARDITRIGGGQLQQRSRLNKIEGRLQGIESNIADIKGLLESIYLLSTATNARSLMESIAQADVAGGTEHDLVEPD